MKHYKVLKGNVGGFGNKTYKKGDAVTDEMFPAGNAETLAKMEFLKEVDAPKKDDKKSEEVEETETETDTDEGNPWEGKTHKDFKKKEIIGFLKSEGIDFNPIATNEELFDLLN